MKKKNGDQVENAPQMTRTSGGLRAVLFDEIDALRNGESNAARARAIAQLANSALRSVIVEIEYHKYVSDVSKTDDNKLGELELSKRQIAMA